MIVVPIVVTVEGAESHSQDEKGQGNNPCPA